MPDDLIRELRQETNYSQIIQGLVRNFFETPDNKKELAKKQEEIKKEFDSEIEKKQAEIQEIMKEKEQTITKIEKVVEEIEVKEKQTKEELDVAADKEERLLIGIMNNAFEIFNCVITQEQARDYRTGDYRNIRDYLVENNLINAAEYPEE
jgi:hypothetical protein